MNHVLSVIRHGTLTRGERALVMAYAMVIAMSAGITILVMSALEGENAIPPEPTFYDNWAIIAGGCAAGLAFFLARSWMGRAGVAGVVRAAFGAVIIAFAAAVIAGTLIAPFMGTIFGPFLLAAAFLAKPWLAVAWVAVAMAGHFLLVVWSGEKTSGNSRMDQSAVSQLSRLSQMNLYRNTHGR
ncbi:hypothetical protein [Yoonia sp.]|jgi:hypothetical protein|uniref:hypothetical protein n=1 Tax=Yoonia sp. TaxID=2212373 RepID=UPI0025F72631|nr:hypothetical protein [Yoonia sp.]